MVVWWLWIPFDYYVHKVYDFIVCTPHMTRTFSVVFWFTPYGVITYVGFERTIAGLWRKLFTPPKSSTRQCRQQQDCFEDEHHYQARFLRVNYGLHLWNPFNNEMNPIHWSAFVIFEKADASFATREVTRVFYSQLSWKIESRAIFVTVTNSNSL